MVSSKTRKSKKSTTVQEDGEQQLAEEANIVSSGASVASSPSNWQT